MSFTKKLITSAVAGSVAGVVANFFVNRKAKQTQGIDKSIKRNEDIRFQSTIEEGHFFV